MELKNVSLEMQLLGWSKSTSKKPPTITLALHSDSDMEFFESLTVAKGGNAGQILQVGIVISPDDPQHGTAASMEPVKSKTKQKKPLSAEATEWMKKEKTTMRPSGFAALTCKEKTYLDYLLGMKFEGDPVGYMKNNCKVQSRSEFDNDPEALKRFIIHINFYRNFVNG